MAKIFTKLNLGDAVYSAGGKMFRKLSTESGGLPIWNGTDLTGTTWNVPSGWWAEAGYGKFIINCILPPSTDIQIGFDIGYTKSGGKAEDGGIRFYNDILNVRYTPTLDFTVTFIGGTDATNTSLISWLKQYGQLTSHTMPTPTIISFTISRTTFQAEEDMTWGEWVDSEYGTKDAGYNEPYVYVSGEYVYYGDWNDDYYITTDGTLDGRVRPTTTIVSGFAYAVL